MHIEPPENYKLFNLLDYTCKIYQANLKPSCSSQLCPPCRDSFTLCCGRSHLIS